MCLGMPCKVVSIKDDMATVVIAGAKKDVSIALTEGVQVGDFVIVHAGFVIELVDRDKAEETLRVVGELLK